MKKQLSFFTFFLVATLGINAQTILFQENFESHPLTTFVHSYDNAAIPNESLECGKTSVGTASFFNSTNMNFKEEENNTVFLGVNAEEPCGGYYNTDVKVENVDLSGVDELYFQCRYFMTSPLDWGSNVLKITLKKDALIHEISTEFTVEDAWTDVALALPNTFIQEGVSIEINIGGEGVAIDNISIADEILTVEEEEEETDDSVLFQEDFETFPLTTFVHSYDNSEIPNEGLACGKASVGTATYFNSTNLDFKPEENNSIFLGVNTEEPCGGYYNTDVKVENVDLSGVDELYFQCRYFMTSPLDWGSNILTVTFKKDALVHEISSEFTVEDAWTDLELALPNTLIQEGVTIEIKIGGEGVAIDNISIVDEIEEEEEEEEEETDDSILFQEDFETFPLTTFVHSYDNAAVPNENLECGKASVGTTTYFNSTSLDFKNDENDSVFLGINTEEPCGGIYDTKVKVENVDLSGVDELFFQCRYFMTSPLDWGETAIKVTFKKDALVHEITSEFSEEDAWTDLEVALPNTFIQEGVTIEIEMKGEGVALDDLFVTKEAKTDGELSIDQNVLEMVKIYPNPTENSINIQHKNKISEISVYDLNGTLLKSEMNTKDGKVSFENYSKGFYIVKVKDEKGNLFIQKVLKK
ncbi:T9SS type A sorting domain-containing protein [Aureivirga sp. CE67]|uniref:T9SS type A sorting domain-containing protein n=1 Tax=Aureivirga sp. CE67 TaxID=1788983 RepID=UPI0018CAEA34|nr:T9SS type A sorting domain-containing protein [Aureivirga sp. CE67]